MLMLKNCRLIPELTEGYPHAAADIILNGERIYRICVPGTYTEPVEEIVDLGGRTVIPGLHDLHVHVHATNKTFLELASKELGVCAFDAYFFARTMMNYGFTTLRDMGSNARCGIALRNAIRKGQVAGPNITSCGLVVAPTESGSSLFHLLHNDGDGCDEMLKHCREEMKEGCDFIKTHATGSILNEGSDPQQCIITKEELETITGAAKAKGRYTAVHCHSAEGIKMCVRAGVRTIEHASLMDREGLQMLLDSDASFAVLTLSASANLALLAASEAKSEKVVKAKKIWPIIQEALTNAYQSGLKVGWGTDILLPEFLENPAGEFLYRQKYLGMSNVDMLLQATKYSAQILGTDRDSGSIKEGKYADIAVIDGKPDEDISVLGTPCYAVYKGGKAYHYPE